MLMSVYIQQIHLNTTQELQIRLDRPSPRLVYASGVSEW